MNTESLGPALSEHKGRIAAGGIGWYVGGLVFVAGIVGFFQALIALDVSRLAYMLVALAITGLWLLYNFARYKQTLTVHRDGFVWNRLFREPRIVRFDDVVGAKITTEVSRNAMHTKGKHVEIEMQMKDGTFLIVTNDMENIEALMGYLKAPNAAPNAASPWA